MKGYMLVPIAAILLAAAMLTAGVMSAGAQPAGNLTCSIVAGACAGGETDILRLSNCTNAHAELPNGTAYNYTLCCKDTDNINQVLNYTGNNFIKLSNWTNAHVELPAYTNYAYPVYIGANASGVVCNPRYVSGDCSATNETCLFTMSNETNAHVANCTPADPATYNLTICCRFAVLAPATLVAIANDTLVDGPDGIMWDNINDGNTTAYLNHTTANLSCRWSDNTEGDLGYNAMSASKNCTVVDYDIICYFGDISQGVYNGSNAYHVACYDNTTGYAQGASDNVDVEFGVDWTGPMSTILAANGTWFNADFTLDVNNTDSLSRVKDCYYNVTDNGIVTVDSAQWITNATWYSAVNATPTITVGLTGNCIAEGANKCAVTAWCTDWAGNVGG